MAAIERLIADSRGNGIEIEFYDDVPTEELPSELQMVVYPIVHELLLNACRHSRSQNVLVGLAQDDERIYIQVQDWGVGFDPGSVSPNKSGLKGLRQLIQGRNGNISIDSRPGAGTCVIVDIPFSQETAPSDRRENPSHNDTHRPLSG